MQKVTHRNLWSLLSLGLTVLNFNIASTYAAEQLYVSYGAFERSISIKELAVYAKEGRVTGDLVPYFRYLKPDQQRQLRHALQQRAPLTPVAVAQFLYSSIGEKLLRRAEKTVRPKSGAGGFYGLRSALILAAADSEGLTFLNLLQKYPTVGIQLNLAEGLATFAQIQELIQETHAAVEAIAAQSAIAPPLFPQDQHQVTAPGPFPWQRVTFDLEDRTPLRLEYTGGDRQFPVDVYLPQGDATPRPVIVISHGLNSNRRSYAYLAEHLATHGFAVAVPEHPGSNTQQTEALLAGRAQEVTHPTEFLDRPLDIKFLLDHLESKSGTEALVQTQLNLEQVGVIGQSFGGYTALALAGAPLNFNQLQPDCESNLDTTLNLSLVLQCQALRLPLRTYQLADRRIKGAIALNPIGSSLFGPEALSHITVPVMVLSGSEDTVAPALFEQIRPFKQLTTLQKYFVLLTRGTHFSTIDNQSELDSDLPPTLTQLIGPSPDLARTYTAALSTAFMQAHIASQDHYRRYLTPGFAAVLSQVSLPLSVTDTIP
jgi:predicted dienelactone hydrolase